MKKLILNGKILEVYDSIDEMPILNFQKYNKYLLIDSGIGSDADDIDSHIIKVAKYIKINDSKKALQELQNMRQAMYMVNSQISPKYMAFAALVKSVNGKKVTDLSDDSLKSLLEELKAVKHSKIVDFLLWLKKKVSTELETYFPQSFVSIKEKDTYDKLKQRTLLILESIIDDKDVDLEVEAIDIALLNAFMPSTFMGSDSVEIRYDKQFESACMIIAQKTNMDARAMTVLQFYNTLDNIKKQLEAETKGLKRTKH